MEQQDPTPREQLGFRAERAVAKLPLAAVSITLALLTQVGVGIWFAAQFVAGKDETDRSLAKIERKVDDIITNRVTARDLEMLGKSLADHETRLRIIERGVRSPP